MPLEDLQKRLLHRLSLLDSAFLRDLNSESIGRRIDRSKRQEGLVSALWQSWCAFCRGILLGSAKGATTQSGVTTASPFSTHLESEIAFVAKQLVTQNAIRRIKPLPSYQEPTWGDPKNIARILSGICCSNSNDLKAAFGGSKRIEDLQMCRNACAHLTSDSLLKVRAAKVRYQETTAFHPSDLIYWVDPNTNDFLWRSWLDEIEMISELAIK